LRKALLDKTPGTHLQNRGLKFAVQTPAGKTTVFIDQKPPSASRKSVKKPRVSAGFKTPNPATQKPYWDVDEADVSQEIILQEEKEDDEEPEYMPPTASCRSNAFGDLRSYLTRVQFLLWNPNTAFEVERS
jgi:hypothetical protein